MAIPAAAVTAAFDRMSVRLKAMVREFGTPPRKARGLRIHARRVKAAKRRG